MANKPIIISLHGIRTDGQWQDKLGEIVEKHGFEHRPFKYGYYDVFRFLNPGSNKKMVEKFYDFYSDLANQTNTVPSVVAHSFGTFIVAHCMLKRHDIRFDKIIFCGSILSRNFEWTTLLARNQINQVLNEFSKLDVWARLVKFFVRKTGRSGYAGSNYKRPNFFEKRFEYDHSDYFSGNHMKENWLSFLTNQSPNFIVRQGNDCRIDEYHQRLAECRTIDHECFGPVINHEEVQLPEGLSKRWISINSDIYTFCYEASSNLVKGYINAMPLKDESFDKLLKGELKDNNIVEDDIEPYTKNQRLKIYLMSLATKEDVRQFRAGLMNTVADRLLAGLFKKLLDYWQDHNIQVTDFAAIAWTPAGKKICELLGMKKIGADKLGHPIYHITTAGNQNLKKHVIQGADLLFRSYNR